MRARLYSPSKTAMSSGMANTHGWYLDFEPEVPGHIDPLMGWTGTEDTQRQVRLHFDTREEAMEYAQEHGITVTVTQPSRRKPNIRPGGYGENFASSRRGAWTH